MKYKRPSDIESQRATAGKTSLFTWVKPELKKMAEQMAEASDCTVSQWIEQAIRTQAARDKRVESACDDGLERPGSSNH